MYIRRNSFTGRLQVRVCRELGQRESPLPKEGQSSGQLCDWAGTAGWLALLYRHGEPGSLMLSGSRAAEWGES
jgi:hypothetical protein